ncbi:MAG TPA: GNAT family N-acetyltransferase [Panacibacter sp.]|nr:GNAT family N-acetyltransferase [Panacibacter sp.]
MNLSFSAAAPEDAGAIAALSNATAQRLTSLYGKGHWSYQCTEKAVLYGMKGNSRMLIAKHEDLLVGTLHLVTKKPWAIDVLYFTSVQQPLYLIGMAVHPDWQHKGIGRYMLQQIIPEVITWPAQSIRLDAYDNAAGAGEFYRKCGYTERGRALYKNNPLIYFELLV